MNSRTLSWVAAMVLAVVAGCGLCRAQQVDGPLARKMDVPPTVDGNLDEWKSFPQITMRQPDVPDLKVERASMGWTDDALHVAFRIVDGTVVNKESLDRLNRADCLELRLCASEQNRGTFLRLCVAPSSVDGKPACSLIRQTVATKATEPLLRTTEPSTLAGFQWALSREEKTWSVEATISAALLGLKAVHGEKLRFVAIAWDRDRTDVDEWTSGSGWNKRSESSSQKAPVEQWPVITLADAQTKEVVPLRDGVSIQRHRPCNLFTPDQNVVLSFTLKGFPAGAASATGVLTDAFGKECGRVAMPLPRAGDGANGPFELDVGRPGRGYYELALTVRTADAEGSATATLGVMEQVSMSVEEFLKQDRRFGLKWWSGVIDKPETIDMMCKLGLQWTRAIIGESVQIVTNSTLLSTVKIERFPKELFDEARYGKLEDWEKQFGRGAWTLKTLPRQAEYKVWLAESLAKLPANQTVFEIWNEPWDKMGPGDFAEISQWVAEVVRKERPGAKLGPNLRGDMSDYGYDAKVVAAGGMKGMDMVCLHPYGVSEDRAFLRTYKAWMSGKVGRQIDIYITEYGSHSCPKGPAQQSEMSQASKVVRQSLALYAEDAKALIPHWVGQSEQNPTYHEDWFGYIRKNQQPKPVLLAHANTARLIDGGKYLGDLWFGPGIGAMVFKKDGQNRLALFTRGEPLEVEVDTGVATVAVVDLFGHEVQQATANGKLKLKLGADVTYLCGLSDEAVAAVSSELRDDRWPAPEKPVRNARTAHKMTMPTLDGKFEDWKGATELYMQNPKVNGDDASGMAYLAWDADYLYLGVNMRDNEMKNKQPRAKLYREDSIELFVSTEARDENPGYGPNDHQFFLTPTSGEGGPVVAKLTDREAGVLVDVVDAKHFLGKTSQGWAGEIALPWSAFGGFKPVVGAEIALEVRVNDADTSHERWKLDPLDGNVNVENPTLWSVLKLVEEPANEARQEQKVLLQLDADGNGLCDDTERKALLDVLQAECPELEGVFDADGDGKVTIQEQAAGRHPLSQLVPQRFLQSDRKIPWAIDLFPEWIMSGYFQEDVAVGAVSGQPVRGTIEVKPLQEDVALQPRKAEVRGGVEFAANSGQHLAMPGHRDARWSYRWCLFSFRLDGSSGSGGDTVLLDLNQGRGPSKSSPKIGYSKKDGLSIQYVGRGKGGLDRRVMATRAVVADGTTWNVVVCGIRQGRMFASVNGVPLTTTDEQPGRFSSEMVYDVTSLIGDKRKGNMAWAYDALVLGQTELSEAMVRKMDGWAAHRLGFQANLPASHAYRSARPVLDAEDFPHRYVHDDAKWTAWGLGIKDKAVTRVNAGGPRVEPQGFERVFHDDFRAMRVKASTSGEGDLWMGFGFNTAVGGDAPLVEPGKEPDVYAHDPVGKKQTLSLVKQGNRWRGSAFYSVNDLGQGYTWAGPKVFRIRCMFPKVDQKELGGGLFPAFWSYGTEWLFWRTSNRIECDWFEFDGHNGKWYNGLSTHYHYAHVKNLFVKQNESYQRYKLYSGELTEEKSKIPGGIFFWDGQFHTWEFVIDQDMTYVNLTIPDGNGGDRWVEVCRGATAPTYLERLDLQLDYALKAKQGLPPTDARQDFVVDWVEVLQKTSAVEKAPEPFAARPVLAGSAAAGGTVTCQPNVEGITDIRYYWFADGYPLTYGASATYTVTPAESGTTLRCMVKAVGARDMPEAWSNGVEIR